MNHYTETHCPVCHSELKPQSAESWTLCSCGWISDSTQAAKSAKSLKWSAIRSFVIISFVMTAGFVHLAKWGNDSINIIAPYAKLIIKSESAEDLQKLAEMHKRHGSIEGSQFFLEKWAQKTQSPEAYNKLGELSFLTKDYQNAIKAYEQYFELAGNETQAYFNLATAYSRTNQADKATLMYTRLIESRPEVYQPTVVTALVELLIEKDQLSEAQNILNNMVGEDYETPGHLKQKRTLVQRILKQRNS